MNREWEEFLQFWKKYPRKIARGDAWKAWQQTRAERPALSALLAAIDAYLEWRKRLPSRNEFVPALVYPATWLRGERWADEFDAAPACAAPAPAIDPAEEKRRIEERMVVMRARGAWGDITAALIHRSAPLGGWPDPLTSAALEKIGGFAVICRCSSTSEIRQLGLKFERSFLDLLGDGPTAASTTIQLRRTA